MTTDFRSYTPSQAADEQGQLPQNGAALPPANNENDDSEAIKYRGTAYGPGVREAVQVTQRSPLGWVQWFSNLSVRQKQLAGLFTSEAISVLGLVGVGSCLIITSGRSQFLNQAKAEQAVTNN